MSNLTADVIARLQDLMAKATPGPWTYKAWDDARIIAPPWPNDERKKPDPRVVLEIAPDGACGDPECCPQTSSLRLSDADATLIVAAVNALPSLLAAEEARTQEMAGGHWTKEAVRDEFMRLSAWIRQPGNINRDDAVDEMARVLMNCAIQVMTPGFKIVKEKAMTYEEKDRLRERMMTTEENGTPGEED